MLPAWTRHEIGVYRSFAAITLLVGLSVSALAVYGFNLDPLEVVPITIAIMAGVGALLIVPYVIVQLSMRWLHRASIDRILIGHIASLVRQKLPLAQGMSLAAASEHGLTRSHLERIARPLAAGHSLSEAIQLGWPDCPGLALSLVIAGEKAGQLPLAVEQVEQLVLRQNRWRDGVDTPFDNSVIPYALVVTAFTFLVTTGIMVAVVPKFKEIFKDFETQLPEMTCNMIGIADWFVAGTPPGWVWLLPPLLALMWLASLNYRPRRVPEPQFTACMADWLRWHTPGLHRLEWSRGMATSLRTMDMGLRAGMGLSDAAWLASGVDVNVRLRAHLEQFAILCEAGTDLREAADRAGLGRVTGLAMESGLRAGDMHTAMHYAADYHDALISRWWFVFRSMAWPVATLGLGVMVGFVVLSLFMPLVTLINSTARCMP